MQVLATAHAMEINDPEKLIDSVHILYVAEQKLVGATALTDSAPISAHGFNSTVPYLLSPYPGSRGDSHLQIVTFMMQASHLVLHIIVISD
ncbi:MAG: hypothetical protein AB8B64_19750 [Granulosicoccus sp.]